VALGLGDVAAATGADRVGVGACVAPELAELGPRVFTTSAMTPRATTVPPARPLATHILRRRCARWYPYRSPPGVPFGPPGAPWPFHVSSPRNSTWVPLPSCPRAAAACTPPACTPPACIASGCTVVGWTPPAGCTAIGWTVVGWTVAASTAGCTAVGRSTGCGTVVASVLAAGGAAVSCTAGCTVVGCTVVGCTAVCCEAPGCAAAADPPPSASVAASAWVWWVQVDPSHQRSSPGTPNGSGYQPEGGNSMLARVDAGGARRARTRCVTSFLAAGCCRARPSRP